MIAANYLLLALGFLGATDILLYHSVSHRIRTHADSRWELMTHALRGPTYAFLFFVTPNFEAHGIIAIFFLGLLLFDIGISVADFWLERQSRALLGGLPSGEYVLHMLIAMVFGGFVTTAAPSLIAWAGLESGLIPTALSPTWLRGTLAIFAVGVFISGAMDAVAALRLNSHGIKFASEK